VRRHAERINIVLLVVLLELKRVVALIAVKDRQPARAYNASLRIGVKVL
jgi:hypothetical protein